MTGTGTSLKPLSMSLLRLSRKIAAIGAKVLGMLVVSATLSVAATLLFAWLLGVVIESVGAPRLLCACLAAIVGLAEYLHITQVPDQEASEYAKHRAMHD